MALSIKNFQTERLARELASATGETVTTAVTRALEERLEQVRRGPEPRELRIAELRRIAADASARWPVALRAAQHGDLLYDEQGLPQ